MDKVKAFFAAKGRVRMLVVLYILAVVVLKSFHLDAIVGYLGVLAAWLPTDSPVSTTDATAAILGVVALIKAFAQYVQGADVADAPPAVAKVPKH